jgi:hypothetical protein
MARPLLYLIPTGKKIMKTYNSLLIASSFAMVAAMVSGCSSGFSTLGAEQESASTGSSTTTSTGTLTLTSSGGTTTNGITNVAMNGTLQFTASGGTGSYLYEIVTPSTGGGSITSTGLYTAPSASVSGVIVGVIDSTGSYQYATVDVGSALSLSASATSVGLSGTITFTASGGTPPYTYSVFSPSSGAGTINSSGTYTAPSSVSTTSGQEVEIEVVDSAGASATEYILVTDGSSGTTTTTSTDSCEGYYNAVFNGSNYTMVMTVDDSGILSGFMSWKNNGETWGIYGTCSSGSISFVREGTGQTFIGSYAESESGVILMGGTFGNGSLDWSAVQGSPPSN